MLFKCTVLPLTLLSTGVFDNFAVLKKQHDNKSRERGALRKVGGGVKCKWRGGILMRQN